MQGVCRYAQLSWALRRSREKVPASFCHRVMAVSGSGVSKWSLEHVGTTGRGVRAGVPKVNNPYPTRCATSLAGALTTECTRAQFPHSGTGAGLEAGGLGFRAPHGCGEIETRRKQCAMRCERTTKSEEAKRVSGGTVTQCATCATTMYQLANTQQYCGVLE